MISVIIPTHNDGNYLRDSIESIQNQTIQNIEIIVVDDFSNDNTENIVKSISKNDNRIRYIRNDFDDPKRINRKGININAGYSARNLGLSIARGEWITFQDGDDVSLLNRLEIQFNLVNELRISHLTNSVIWFKNDYIGKKIMFNDYIIDNPIKKNLLNSDYIYTIAKSGRGMLLKVIPSYVFSKIPFEFKTKRYLNRLFYGNFDSYIGAAGPTFFKREIIKSIKFRNLDSRVWPSLRGRGADRDFNFNIAYTFKDSAFVDIPLYCWRTPTPFKDKYCIDKYIY